MKSWQIRCKGIVQGVGFRPTVYKLAQNHKLVGEVSNGPEGVRIVFNASEQSAHIFFDDLLKRAPRLSHISFKELIEIPARSFPDFQIVASERLGEKDLLFTPDFGLCETCRAEIEDSSNRRQGYAFTTCTLCGPRYSIIQDLPYDRELTSMQLFEMCESCQKEYELPTDRRYYSQSNSCSTCGIALSLWDASGKKSFPSEAALIFYVVKAWNAGKIIAIKGIGGFLLSCDATQASAVQRLREKKHRPVKPLALMYPGWEELKSYDFSWDEQAELVGAVSPILLLRKGPGYDLPEEIAPGLDAVGIMLPYTPLYQLLLSAFQKPIVASSANVSNSPIIYESDKVEELLQIADLVLDNDREIVIPQDDSVLRYTKFYKQRIIIRRSRGLAPSFFHKEEEQEESFLACGADMKSSLALRHRGKFYISQYLGDLGHFDTEVSFRKVQAHLQKVLKPEIQHIFHDLHPNYASSRLAEGLADKYQIPKTAFQHHEAHFAAILGEHELQKSDEAILGVIWDGTGYGKDGNIWGGEFFLYQTGEIKRLNHLAYYPSLGGDKFAKEPRMALFSLLPHHEKVGEKFSDSEVKIYNKLHSSSQIRSSSMGRIFDAAASLLGICDKQIYESEAAMKLEALASKYFGNSLAFREQYEIPIHPEGLQVIPMFEEMFAEKEAGKSRGEIAAKFHNSLVKLIEKIAQDAEIRKIAFSGGVFQNALLQDLCIDRMGKAYDLYFHKQLSPNDENIAFGQLILADLFKV